MSTTTPSVLDAEAHVAALIDELAAIEEALGRCVWERDSLRIVAAYQAHRIVELERQLASLPDPQTSSDWHRSVRSARLDPESGVSSHPGDSGPKNAR